MNPYYAPIPRSFSTWLRVLSKDSGSKPINERDAEVFGLLANGIDLHAKREASFLEALEAIADGDGDAQEIARQTLEVSRQLQVVPNGQ